MGKIARIINKYFHLNFKEKANINSRFSLASNAFVAVCKMVMGIFSTSIFLFISAFYSLGCAASKQTYFVGLAYSKIDKEQETKYYLKIAIMLLFTDIIYIIYMIRLFFIPSVSHYPKIVGIALATISTLEMYFAISGLIKSKKLGSDYLLVDNIDQYCAESPNNIDNIKLLIKELEAIKLPVIIGNANNFFNQYNNDKELFDKIYGIYQKNFIIDVINKNNAGKVLLNKIEDNYKRIYTTEQALDKKHEQKILEFAINHDCNVDIENS